MENNKNQEDFSEIKDIILQEKEEAMPIFRLHDFRSRLKARVESESRKKFHFPLWLRKPLPSLVILLLLLSVGTVTILTIFSPSAYERSLRIIEKSLQQTPGLQKLMEADKLAKTTQMNNKFSELEWEIRYILFSLSPGSFSSEGLSSAFNKVLLRLQTEKQEIVILPKKENTEMTDLKKEIEMIMKNKNFNQFFSQILKKLEEE